MNRRLATTCMALFLLHLPQALRAQDQADSAAYRALTQTPLNGFSALPGAGLIDGGSAGTSVQARYGLMSFRSRDFIHNFGLGISFPVAAGDLSVVAGRYNPTCPRDDCPGHFMASVEFEQRLVRLGLGRPEESGNFDIGLRTGLGVGRPEGTTLFSGAASLYLSLAPWVSGTRLYPFLTPGLGFGLIDVETGTDAGMLPMLGGGVGVLALDDRLNIAAGVQRAFLRGGNWLAGVNVRMAIARRRAAVPATLPPDSSAVP